MGLSETLEYTTSAGHLFYDANGRPHRMTDDNDVQPASSGLKDGAQATGQISRVPDANGLLTGRDRLPGFTGEWMRVALGDVATLILGKGLKKDDLVHDGKSKCIHYGELFGRHGVQVRKIVNRTNFKGSVLSKRNDVLMPSVGVILHRATCLMEDDVIIGDNTIIIRPNRDDLNGTFLAYCIRASEEQIMRMATGSAFPFVSKKNMERFEFLMPSRQEQDAIVGVLSDFDDLISGLDDLITKKSQIKDGAVRGLLSGDLRLDGFHESWGAPVALGDVATLIKGASLSKKEVERGGEVRCVHSGELHGGHGPLITNITSRTQHFRGETISKKNDVLLPRSGHPLHLASCLMEDGVIEAGNFFIIRPDSKDISGIFLAYCIRASEEQINNFARGDFQTLYATDVVKFNFPLPPRREQDAIVDVLMDMDSELLSLKSKRARIADVQIGLMQELLFGRIRQRRPENEAQ